MNGKYFKAIIISLVAILFSNIIIPTANVFAAEEDIYQKLDQIDQAEFELVLDQITEYSEYDYVTGKWVLNYKIVEDGVFTEEQYINAEESGKEWEKVEALADEGKEEGTITTFALPALLILAIKAVGVIVGTTVVTEITTAFTNWGMVSACKKFKKYGPIKSFCSANDYI